MYVLRFSGVGLKLARIQSKEDGSLESSELGGAIVVTGKESCDFCVE